MNLFESDMTRVLLYSPQTEKNLKHTVISDRAPYF